MLGDRTPATRALYELERLAFVPRAPCELRNEAGYAWNCSLERSIVIDLYELTRRDHARLCELAGLERQADDHAWIEAESFGPEETLDWPTFLTHEEAVEVALVRGMRLPTAREWLHVAVGRRALPYPWGGKEQDSVANTLKTRLDRPTNVGTFESGRSRLFGCYDLLGNVWEWVSDAVPGVIDDQDAELSDRRPEVPGDRYSALGGAYSSHPRPNFALVRVNLSHGRSELRWRFHARLEDPRTLNTAIGARMCADAETYLWEQAPRWGHGDEARSRVAAVARRWSQDRVAYRMLTELVSELGQRPAAPEALEWLAEGLASSAAP